MRFEVRALIKAPTAFGAFVRRIFHVKYTMNGKRPALTKALSTFSTFKWLLLRVNVSETTNTQY